MGTVPPLLTQFRKDATTIAPGRSQASDGTLPSAAHSSQNPTSDHEPDARGICHAVDLTHDPAGGFDSWRWAQWLANRCRIGADQRIKYIVAYDPARGYDVIASAVGNWAWRQNGSTPKRDHPNHVHISILSGASIENSTAPTLFLEDDDMTEAECRKVIKEELAAFFKDGNPDGAGRKAMSESVARQIDTRLLPSLLKNPPKP